MKQYDAIIIGFGKGGKTLAAELAKRNEKVAVIERSDEMYGGTCINIGCIPTKTLVHQAKLAPVKASWEEKKAYYAQAIAEKEEVTSFLRQKNYHNLADNPHITVYTGIGSFVSTDVVEVVMHDEILQLQAPRIYINTGAETIIPPIDGVKDNPLVYTSTSIMELEKLPRHLVIVGGGYIGLEFASMFAGFGSKVTILEAGEVFIPREDRDIADSVKSTLEKKGITIHLNTVVQTIEQDVERAAVICRNAISGDTLRLEAEAVLLATGRKPNTESLNLQAAGIQTTNRGAIEVDSKLRTNIPNIWAIGDVHGGLQFTYLSLDDYRIIREELFGNGFRSLDDREAVAYSVFIDPPLAHVGLNETQARKMEKNIKVASLPAAAMPRTRTIEQTDGLLKAVVDADTGKILGCTLFCAESSEVINTVSLAMRLGQDYTFLRDSIFTHPSMSEALNDLFGLIK